MRSFINSVQFDCNVKLRPARSKHIEDQPEERARRPGLQARVLRLMFFLVASAVLAWTGKYGLECTYCLCTGQEKHMSIGQICHQVKGYHMAQKTAEKPYWRHR